MTKAFLKTLFTATARQQRDMKYLANSISMSDFEQRQRHLDKKSYPHTPFGL